MSSESVRLCALTMKCHNLIWKTLLVNLLVRFHIHSKLVNFMAPIDSSSMSDDARWVTSYVLLMSDVLYLLKCQSQTSDHTHTLTFVRYIKLSKGIEWKSVPFTHPKAVEHEMFSRKSQLMFSEQQLQNSQRSTRKAVHMKLYNSFMWWTDWTCY